MGNNTCKEKTNRPPCNCMCNDNLDWIYMKIPIEWTCIYYRLIEAIAKFGDNMLYDCKSSCKDSNKSLINCWYMFVSAVSAYHMGQYKLAETLLKYIKAQLKLIYKENCSSELQCLTVFPIKSDGKLKALINEASENIHFKVCLETGNLYEEAPQDKLDRYPFSIENNNLTYYIR